MKKGKKREHAKERHGETCMCKKCRGRIEAVFYRKGTKTRLRDFKTTGLIQQQDYNDD